MKLSYGDTWLLLLYKGERDAGWDQEHVTIEEVLFLPRVMSVSS